MKDEQHQRELQRKAESGAQSTPAWMALTGMAARCGLNDHGDDDIATQALQLTKPRRRLFFPAATW